MTTALCTTVRGEHLIPVLGQQIRAVSVRAPGCRSYFETASGQASKCSIHLSSTLILTLPWSASTCLAPAVHPIRPCPMAFRIWPRRCEGCSTSSNCKSVSTCSGCHGGGGLAQQFAVHNPRRCRRLILVATATGIAMVPGKPTVLAKMLTPQRFLDHDYAASIAGDLYGGTVLTDASLVKWLFARQLMAGSRVGYLHQLLAGSVWTSLFALPLVRATTGPCAHRCRRA